MSIFPPYYQRFPTNLSLYATTQTSPLDSSLPSLPGLAHLFSSLSQSRHNFSQAFMRNSFSCVAKASAHIHVFRVSSYTWNCLSGYFPKQWHFFSPKRNPGTISLKISSSLSSTMYIYLSTLISIYELIEIYFSHYFANTLLFINAVHVCYFNKHPPNYQVFSYFQFYFVLHHI